MHFTSGSLLYLFMSAFAQPVIDTGGFNLIEIKSGKCLKRCHFLEPEIVIGELKMLGEMMKLDF